MLENLYIILFYIGGFCLALSVGYFLLVSFMFCVYKFLDNGKMNFRQYIKYWE